MRYFLISGIANKRYEQDVCSIWCKEDTDLLPSADSLLDSLKADGVTKFTVNNIVELKKEDYENYLGIKHDADSSTE